MKLKDKIEKSIEKLLKKIDRAKSVQAIENLRKKIQVKKSLLVTLDEELILITKLTTEKKKK